MTSVALSLALLLALCSTLPTAVVAGSCPSPFEVCTDTGACALDVSLCGSCAAGELVCPLTNACVRIGDERACPGLKGTWFDESLGAAARAKLLVSKMTVDEMSQQMSNFARSIPRLGLPRFAWYVRDETTMKPYSVLHTGKRGGHTAPARTSRMVGFHDSAIELYSTVCIRHPHRPTRRLADNLHGVRGSEAPVDDGRVGRHHDYPIVYTNSSSIFPSGPALGASFNRTLLASVGRAVGVESRAAYNEEVRTGRRGWAPKDDGWPAISVNGPGISVYSPNVNLIRDPRWGRNAEVCPPLLTSMPIITFDRLPTPPPPPPPPPSVALLTQRSLLVMNAIRFTPSAPSSPRS